MNRSMSRTVSVSWTRAPASHDQAALQDKIMSKKNRFSAWISRDVNGQMYIDKMLPR